MAYCIEEYKAAEYLNGRGNRMGSPSDLERLRKTLNRYGLPKRGVRFLSFDSERGVDARKQTLRRRFLVTGCAVDLPGAKKPPTVLFSSVGES